MARMFALLCFTVLAACSKGPLTPETKVNVREGVAVKGYDVVAYQTEAKAVRGDSRYDVSLDGVTYHFASEANRDTFQAAPEKYLPAYGGYCAYAMSNGDIVDINPKNWSVVDNKLYLNANIFAEALFSLNKRGTIIKANEHWRTKIEALDTHPAINTNS